MEEAVAEKPVRRRFTAEYKLRQAETIIEVQKNSRRCWGFPCRRPTTAGASHEGHRRTLSAGGHGRASPVTD
jgi:hypothetical protein